MCANILLHGGGGNLPLWPPSDTLHTEGMEEGGGSRGSRRLVYFPDVAFSLRSHAAFTD